MPTPIRTTRQPARAVARPASRRLPGRTPPPPRTSTSTAIDPATFRASIAAVMALTVVATGYTVRSLLREEDGPQTGCVISLDAQGATGHMGDTYEGWLPGQVVDCAKDSRGVVDVSLATSETKTNGTPSEKVNLRDDVQLTGNDEVDGKRIDDEIEDFIDRVHEKILGAPRQETVGTDLVGVTCVAADLLKGRTDKRLILMSDGVHARAPYRLRYVPLDDESIATYVDELVSSGMACPLPGVDVYVYGAGMGRTTDVLEPGRLEAIERFWAQLFEALGANLVAYQRQP